MPTNDRNDHSPTNPNFGWHGPDVTKRPTPEQCDELRRTAKAHNAALTGSLEHATLEFAVGPNPSEAAVIVHDLGLANQASSFAFVRRILALEARVRELEAEVFVMDHAHKDLVGRIARLENRK